MGSDIHYSHAHLSTRRRKPEARFPKVIRRFYDLQMWKNKVFHGFRKSGSRRAAIVVQHARTLRSTQPINTPPPFNIQSEQTGDLITSRHEIKNPNQTNLPSPQNKLQ